MKKTKSAVPTSISSAASARWLSATLEAARVEVNSAPTDEAVERIRARVFGETAGGRRARTLAA